MASAKIKQVNRCWGLFLIKTVFKIPLVYPFRFRHKSHKVRPKRYSRELTNTSERKLVTLKAARPKQDTNRNENISQIEIFCFN